MTILWILATILTIIPWCLVPTVKAQGFPSNLDFQTFDVNQSDMLNFLGHAKIDSVSQTLRLSDPSDVNCQTNPCVGQVFFQQPVQLLDPVTNKTYSFSTSFTFTITSPMRLPTGDGFVFLLAANPLQDAIKSGTFGCFPSASVKSVNPVVAVEFDTSLSTDLFDINDNHIGIDINYAQSIQASDANSLSIRLSSGMLITSWIDYHHMYQSFEVRLSYYTVGATKPINPLLTLPLDLSRSWDPKMYVGFSTQIYHGSEQSCNIFSWSFRSFVEVTLPPPPPSGEFNQTSNSTTWAQKTIGLGKIIGVAIAAFLLVAGVCVATLGYARFGCSVIADPVDLWNPEESILTNTKKKRKLKEIDDANDAKDNISIGTKQTSNRHILGFGDIMFTNVVYNIPPLDSSEANVTYTSSTYSKEMMGSTFEDVEGEVEKITSYDSDRTPLQEQVAWLLEKARFDVENFTEAQRFTYRELNEATDNFSETLELGEGRYGVFYGGILANGVQIAVKRLARIQNQKTWKFKAEVTMLYHLQHPNLVDLIGWCKQSDEYFLVYNLISNGNLSRIIFLKGAISWLERFKIIQNIADALKYLHQNSILHRNVKTTNIFLTSDNDAKLGDFGLVWLMDSDEDKGTKEYVAPEVYITHKLTQQTDVFSFGIVALEILFERPVYDLNANSDSIYLVNLVSTLMDSGTLRKEVSKDGHKLQEETDDPLMTLVASICLLCCDENPMHRPSMKRVVQCLAGDIPFPYGSESLDINITPSYETNFTTENVNTTIAIGPKKSSRSSSSSDLLQNDTILSFLTTSIIDKQIETPSSALKRSQGSSFSPTLVQRVTTSTHKTNSIIAKKRTSLAYAVKKSTSSSSSSMVHTPSLHGVPILDTKKAVNAVILNAEQQTTWADSCWKLHRDNYTKIIVILSIKVESYNPSTPVIKWMLLNDEVNFSAHGQEFHGSIIYNFCYSLLKGLASIFKLLKYVDDDQLSLIETFSHEESPMTSVHPPGPPFRPPPNPPFRPPPIPPPHRPPPPPSPIPEPDPPFPIPGPIPRRPPPGPPPPRMSEALVECREH